MILAVQSISFNFFPLKTIVGFIIRLFIAFACVRLVKEFPRTYINVMYGICIISFCFYVPEQLFHAVGRDFASLFTPWVNLIRKVFLRNVYEDATILIYNYEHPHEVLRNAGLFWEPGAFAGYILLGLIFLGLKKDSYAKRFYMTRFVVLTIALLTTLSTMGYVLYPVVLGLHYRPKEKMVTETLGWLSIIILASPLLIFSAIKAWNLDHIGPKITNQYEVTINRSEKNWYRTRFGSVIFEWKYIKRRPILGWGIHPKTRYALNPRDEFAKGRANGLSSFVHGFGFFGLGIFIFAAWKGLHLLSRNNFFRSSLAIAVILLILIDEAFLQYPLFLGLMFLEKSRRKSAKENAAKNQDYEANLGPSEVPKSGILL
jgi:hypothetical protein